MSATPGFPTATRRHRSRGARPRSATSAALSCGGADVQGEPWRAVWANSAKPPLAFGSDRSQGARPRSATSPAHCSTVVSTGSILRAPDLAQRRHQPRVPPSCRTQSVLRAPDLAQRRQQPGVPDVPATAEEAAAFADSAPSRNPTYRSRGETSTLDVSNPGLPTVSPLPVVTSDRDIARRPGRGPSDELDPAGPWRPPGNEPG